MGLKLRPPQPNTRLLPSAGLYWQMRGMLLSLQAREENYGVARGGHCVVSTSWVGIRDGLGNRRKCLGTLQVTSCVGLTTLLGFQHRWVHCCLGALAITPSQRASSEL